MTIIVPKEPPPEKHDPCPTCGTQGKLVNISATGVPGYFCQACNKDYFGKVRR